MKVAFITRATLFNVPGGDTVQIIETAGYLRKLNAEVDIILSGKKINYSKYDLFHFFNITRPADILRYIKKIEAPVILSPILVDYSEYFSVAERVYFAMKQVLTAFAQTIYPNVCRLATQGGTTLKQYFKKIFIPFLLLTTIASAVVIILAPLIIGFFMHEQHDEAVLLLRLLCIAVPVVCLNIPGSLSLLALNKKKTYFLIYLSGLLLCITGNLVLASIYGARGTVVSIYLTELFITTGVSLALIKIFRSYAGNKQP